MKNIVILINMTVLRNHLTLKICHPNSNFNLQNLNFTHTVQKLHLFYFILPTTNTLSAVKLY